MTESSLYQKYSDPWFANLYFQYGSAEKVLSHFLLKGESLPISIAGYHRLINKLGIIKSVGRKETKFNEALYFFAHKALEPALPLAKIYRDYMPLQFDTSLVSLHRIYNNVLGGDISKHAVALIISKDYSDKFLIADETTSSIRYGKYAGDATIPMTYAKANESTEVSLLRLLQQEVFTSLAIEGKLSKQSTLAKNLINKSVFQTNFDILNVRIAVYKLLLPSDSQMTFSSHKLSNHRFINLDEMANSNLAFRWGVEEIVNQKSTSRLNYLLNASI